MRLTTIALLLATMAVPSAAATVDPDLTISAFSASAPSQPAAPGATVTATASVTASGAAAPGFWVRFYLSPDPAITTADTLLGSRWVSGLSAGTTGTISSSLQLPAGATGTYYVGAIADADGGVLESDETNNAAAGPALTIAWPDLSMAAVSGPASSFEMGIIAVENSVTASAAGGAAGGFYVGIFLSTDPTITSADTLLGYRWVAGLQPGQSSTEVTSVTIPSNVAPGTYYLGAIADDFYVSGCDEWESCWSAENLVPESDATNNALLGGELTVGGAELTLQEVSAAPTGVTGGQLVIHDTVTATGGGAAYVTVSYYLSKDTNVTTADVYLGARTVYALHAGESSTADTTVTIPVSLATGTYFVGAIVDPSNQVKETTETNNALAGSTIVVGGSDLVASAVVAPDSVGTATSFTVSSTVSNAGPGASPSFTLGFYLSTDSTITTSDPIVGQVSLAGLAAGASTTVTATVSIPSSFRPGQYSLGVIVDPGNSIGEGDEANNTASAPLRLVGPDLVISALTGPTTVRTGDAITLTSTIAALATGGNASSAEVRLFLSTDPVITSSDIYLGQRAATNGLASGASSTGDTAVTIPTTIPGGTYYLGAIADPRNVVAEADETNNALAYAVTVLGPDLSITAVSGPSNGLTAGMIAVENTVAARASGGGASDFYVGIYLSTDAVITTADTLLGYRHVGALQAGSSSTETTTVVIPGNLAPGTYYLGAIADNFPAWVDDGYDSWVIQDVVKETDETNNAFAGETLVVGGADLVVTALSAPATGGSGASLAIHDIVATTAGGTGPFYVSYYLSADAAITASDVYLGRRYVAKLDPGASSTADTTVTVPYNVAPGTYYLGAIVDSQSQVVETNEANNAATGGTVTISGPDLVATGLSVPSSIGTATGFPVTLTVANRGAGGSGSTYAYYYLSTDATITSSDVYLGSASFSALGPGASTSVTTNLTIPNRVAGGTYFLGVLLDPNNGVAEADETNNTLASQAMTVVGPDLTMTALSGPSAAPTGGSITVSSTVTASASGGGASGFYVGFYLSKDLVLDGTDVFLGSRYVSGLAPGASSSANTALTVPTSIAGGTYYLVAVADSSKSIVETDETNNALFASSLAIAGPDLAVTSVVGPSTGLTAGPIEVQNTVVASASGGGTPEFYVGIYLSTDAVVTTSDTLLGYRYVGPMQPGGVSTAVTTVMLPGNLTPGTYYIGAIADNFPAWVDDGYDSWLVQDNVKETDENNNALVGGPITVAGTDLTVAQVTAPSTGATGATLLVHDAITASPGGANGFFVTFYLSTDATITTSDVSLGSRYVSHVDPGATSTADTNVTVPLNLAPGTYFVGAIVDSQKQVVETSETNNALAGNTVTITGPDLTMASVSAPSTILTGATISVTDTVQASASGGGAGGFYVGYYLSHDDVITTSDVVLGSRYVSSLAAGATSTATKTITVPAGIAPGTYRLGAIADSSQGVPESDENNNTVLGPLVTVVGSDLVAAAVTAPTLARTGDTIVVSNTVTASATGGSAPGFYVSIFLSTDPVITSSDIRLADRWVSGLAPGASSAANTQITIPTTFAGGPYYLGILVDSRGNVSESDETNNARVAGPFEVFAPDLVASTISGPTSGVAGTAITVDNAVTAAASGGAPPDFYVGIFLSTDDVITSSDQLLGYRLVSGLNPGGTSAASTTVMLPANLAPGQYRLGLIVDDFPVWVDDGYDYWVVEDSVKESDETNNVLLGNAIVTAPLDLALTALSASPTTVGAGDSLAISETVTVSGGAVGGFWVKYYLSSDTAITSSDIYLGGRWIPALAAGASSSAVTTVTVPAGVSGTFRLGAIVDADGGVLETNEANNTRVGDVITVVLPDLAVAAVSASPAKVPEGQSVSVTSSVTCAGAPAAGFWVKYYLSPDATITTGDLYLGGRWVSGLAAGATSADTQSFPVPAGVNGTYFVGAIVDADGGVVESNDSNNALAGAQIEVGVDVTPPVVALSGIASGAVVNQDVTVCYTATDDHLASVQATLDTSSFGAGAASACGTASADGTHQVSVTARDAAGNADTKSLSFTIDKVVPDVAVVSPGDGSITAAGTVEVVVAASDDRALALVQVNGAAATSGPDGRWHATLGLGTGPQLIEAYARDAAGNARSATVTLTRDSDAPVVTLSSPAEGATLNSETITVAGRVDDATAVQLTVGGEPVAIGPDGSFSTTIHRSSGAQTIVVSATDAAGNATTVTRHVTVAAQPPALVISEPQSGFVATHTPLTVRGTAKSEGSGPVTVTVNGASVPVGSDGSFSGTVELSSGAVTVTVVATDSAARTTQASVSGSYHPSGSDEPTDGALALVVSSPADQAVTGLGSIAFEGRVDGGTPPYQVTVAGVAAVVNGGAFSAALQLVEGDHAVEIRATDSAGHGATATRNVSVDHTAPYLEITRPSAPTSDVAESPYLVEGTVGDAHLATVTVQGEAATVIAGQFSRAVPLQAGDNTVTVVATDVAGNGTTRTVALHVASLPPAVTIIEPLDGAEAPGAIVHVRASVDATSALQSVSIGTGPAELQGGEWVADFALALGDNTITVRATDAAGMTGTASVRVRYRDPSQEPLAVIGVEPAPGASGIDPTSLVTVSFNKPVQRDSVAGAFTVTANGSPLEGGYYVAPGEQLASFIARQPLPPGQRLEVRVAGVKAKTGPGMAADFSSDFTVQTPRRHLMGNVVDPQFQPVDGVRVELEGTGLTTRTAPDGSWVITEAPAGTATVRFEGGKLPDGGSMPTVRRRVFVDGGGDSKDRLLVLTPVEPLATARIDGRADTHAAFTIRYPGLALDLSADGVFFQDGQTQGYVTATEIQPWANPVPVESNMVIGGLWQVQPAGITAAKPVSLSMPNLPGLPPGRYAVALTYDPSRHMLQRTGLVRVSDDGSVLQTIEPVVAGGLDLFGFALLSDEQQQVVVDVLAGKTPAPPTGATPSGSGASLTTTAKVKLALFKLLLLPFGGEAQAQLGIGGSFGIGGFGIGWGGIDAYQRGPGVHWVSGRVRSPQDMQVDVQVIRGELTVAEQIVDLPYSHDAEFWVLSDDYDQGGASPITARLRVNRASVTRNATDPSAPAYLSREELPPPADQVDQWGTVDHPRTGQGKLSIVASVPLELGTTLLTVEGMQARSTGSTATRTRRLVAELTAIPNDPGADGTVDPTPKKAKLTIKRSDEPLDRAFSYDAGGYHYDSGGTSYFRNWTVTADSVTKTTAVTGPTGSFSMGVFSYGSYSRGIVCTEVDAGLRWIPYVDPSSDKDHPKIAYDWYRTGYPICTNTWMPPGGSSRVQLVVDARLLLGDVTFFNRDEKKVGCDGDSPTTWDPESNELASINPDDVSMTEVYFFREDDLREPIAKYSVAAPDLDRSTGKLVCGLGPHARYSRLRLGPADRTTRRIREQCDYYKSRGETDNAWYRVECATKTRVNTLRLSAGDRLVVVGVNHATGYAGTTTVIVPPIQTVAGSSDGSCPADAAAGGPIEFYDYGQKYTISRCAQQDIRVPANLRLYPPEVDLRIARQVKDEGAVEGGQPMRTHLVRHGGAATTRDQFIQISSHWRVRLPPTAPVPPDPKYLEWLAQHDGNALPIQPATYTAPNPIPRPQNADPAWTWSTSGSAAGAIVDVFDTDGDGVPDAQDRCPDLFGVASAQGCPTWMDSDRDGTVDQDDKCPTQPGPEDSPAGKGCPDPARPLWQPTASALPTDDADLDGVKDQDDRCPLYPGRAEDGGCPVLASRFDVDGDGIPDADDQCIMMPGPIETNGCPDPARPDWAPPARPPRNPGDPGRVLEKYCAELDSPTADQLKICRKLEERLVDMPAGVPPLAAHLVKLPGAATVPGSDKPFPILPGAHTNNVQASFRVLGGAGSSGAQDIQNLEVANYYVHVVGNMVLVNDQNGDWAIDSKKEIAVAPPAFVQPANPPASWPEGLPERAIPVKAVYRSWEPDSTLVERYDRAREHEFRVVNLDVKALNGILGQDQRRSLTNPTAADNVAAHTAQEGDLGYEMLFSLLQPQYDGRSGTFAKDYLATGEVQVRLGTDAYGIDCKVDTQDPANAKATCDGAYLYDVLSARDIVYLGLYLRGNAENMLYRYNMLGLAPRRDLVTAGHQSTTQAAVSADRSDGTAVDERPVSQPALANVFVAPAEFRSALVSFCAGKCEDTGLLKQVRLERQADDTFTMYDVAGRPSYPMPEKVDKAGLERATLLRLPLPPEITGMPGTDKLKDFAATDVIVKMKELQPAPQTTAREVVVNLGKPQGDFQGANARAPGQDGVGGVNVADGHLSFRHEDLSFPEFGTTVRFGRTYNNTDNEPGTLGIGWRHNLESYVVEESLGRYSMVLEGQSYDFPSCATLDPKEKTATECKTDNSHGGTLSVSKYPSGDPKIEFVSASGKRYRFDRWAQGALQLVGLANRVRTGESVQHDVLADEQAKLLERDQTTIWTQPAKKQVREAGRRRWVLTAFEDGHGAYDSSDATRSERPGDRWTHLEYFADSDMVRRVYRKTGKLEMLFVYQPVPETYPPRFRALAVAENFGLLQYVLVRFQGATPSPKLDDYVRKLEFRRKPVGSRDGDPEVGNLTEVIRYFKGPDGKDQEDQRWVYGYARDPKTSLACSPPLRGGDLWAAINELEDAALKVYGSVQSRTRWSRSVCRSWKGFPHQRAFEIVDSVALPGTSEVGPDPAVAAIEHPVTITYADDSTRIVKRPDGVLVNVDINRYGNVSAETLGINGPVVTTDWLSKEVGKPVVPKQVQSPQNRTLEYTADARLRPLTTKLAAAGSEDTLPTQGAEPGTTLRSVAPDDIQQRYGIPAKVTHATATGTSTVETDVAIADKPENSTGDVQRVAVKQGDETLLEWKGNQYDLEGVLYSEADAVGRKTTYGNSLEDRGNAWGQRELATITLDSAASTALKTFRRKTEWDAFGRVTRVTDDVGHREEWIYDEAGRLKEHVVRGVPDEHWTYDYQGGTGDEPALTITEHLLETGHERVRTFRDGQLVKETFRYGTRSPSDHGMRTFEYSGGRVVRSTDERGIKREYHYDGNRGWLLNIEATDDRDPANVRKVKEVEYAYDGEGRIKQETDQNGLVTTTEFDKLGRPARWDYQGTDFAGKDVETVKLDPNGVPTERTHGSYVWTYDTDALGRIRRAYGTGTRSGELLTRVDYDAAGRKVYSHDSVLELEEWWEYNDVLGRLTAYRRKVQPGDKTFKEVRTYADTAVELNAAGSHSVTVEQWADSSAGDVTKRQRSTVDDAGRVLDVTDFVPGALDPLTGTRGSPCESTRSFTYDPRGNVKTEKFAVNDTPAAATITNVFDAVGYQVEQQEPSDDGAGTHVTRFVTDAAGLVIEKIGASEDDHWFFGYDLFRQVASKRLVPKEGSRATPAAWIYEYRLSDGATVQETDPDGYQTKRWYNARQKLLKEVRKDVGTSRSTQNERVTVNEYDGPWVLRQTVTEGNWKNVIERSDYDLRGRIRQEVESFIAPGTDGYKYTSNFGWVGRSAQVQQRWQKYGGAQSGARSGAIEVDSLEDVISRKWGTFEDTFTFDAAGRKLQELAAGQPSPTLYRYVHDLLVEVDLGDEATFYDYWLSGKQKRIVDPSGREKLLSWTARGLLADERYGRDDDYDTRSYTYDPLGRTATMTVGGLKDPRTWTYANGPRGELLAVTQPVEGGTFLYEYDGRLNLTAITPPADGGSKVQRFRYDYLGRQVRRDRGTNAWWTAAWEDGTGTTADASGRTVVRILDGRGREAGAQYSGAPGDLTGVDSYYDVLDQPREKIERRQSGDVTVAFAYDDPRALLTGISRGGVAQVGYGYSASGRRKWVQTPSSQVSFGYDGTYDRLQSIQRGTDPATTISWEAGGARLARIEGGGLVECRSYDGPGRISKLTNAAASEGCDTLTPHARFVYGYDGRGNRTSEEYSSASGAEAPTRYGYDGADRLTGVQYGDGRATLYKLGADGSRMGEKEIASYSGPLGPEYYAAASATLEKTYQYDTEGALTDIVDGAGNTIAHYQVDLAGRVLLERRPGDGVDKTFAWDASGRLTEARISRTVAGAGASADTMQYVYDFAGRRIAKHGPSGDQSYLWGDDELLEETTVSGARLAYERAGDLVLGVNGERVLHDGLGSIVGRLRADQPLVSYRYDAWGGFRSGTTGPGGTEASLAYAGQHWDADLRLSYAQQRWYQPETGRFLSEDPVVGDPLRPDSLHAFGYAGGNPLTFVDTDGRAHYVPGQWSWVPDDDEQDLAALMKGRSVSGLNSTTVMYWDAYEAAKGTADEAKRYKAFLEKLDSEDFNQNVVAPTTAAGVVAYAAPAGVAIGGTLAIGHRYLERKDEGKPFTSTDLSDAAYGGAMTGAAAQTAFRVLPAKAAVVLGAGLSGAQIGTGVNEVADGKWRTGLFDMATGGLGMWASARAAQNMTPVPKKATWQDFLPAAKERLASAKGEYGEFGFQAVQKPPSLSATKAALAKVHAKVGKLAKGRPGKFGSPQAGTPKKGYRLDPAHPDVPPDSVEAKPHINWWDYSQGKRGRGGASGAVPIEEGSE